MHAELEGLICSGPRRGKQFTYALMDERVPRSRVQPSDQVLAELTKRYFSSHGPATTKDFAWWSGQTIAQAKLGIMLIERDLDRLEKNGLTYWSIPIDDARGRSFSSTYLLPNYDEFLIAYKNRNEVLADPKQRVLRPPSIEEPPHHVILDGQLAGSWRRSVKGSDVHVDVQLFTATPSKRHRREIVAAAGRLSTFLNVPVKMAIA